MRASVIYETMRKEVAQFFLSPVAYLFIGAFLAVTLYLFFWGAAFFARNIADIRPVFESLPVLLIFLAAALSMRMWSEERRSGTLEFVATLPVSTGELVIGKLLACWALLGLSLLLTLPLPITVAALGDLDWGPVGSGYLAAMLLGGAYLAIGLFVSARTDSQMVSLIVSVMLCGTFYLLGSEAITELMSTEVRQLLVALGSGSRFESITRGLIDFRDMYFYGSIIGIFVLLNVYALNSERWATDNHAAGHSRQRLIATLAIANLALANVWLAPVNTLRFDSTQGQIYSISPATQTYLAQLKEPLLIRGYFSAKTHPLLAPLVPQLANLLQEYEVAGNGQVRVEIVDPAEDPAIENEANTKYGIQAFPFQSADRYQVSLVNSYFDVLVAYGDEYQVLNYEDLIEFKANSEVDLDVRLKNPEFDITRSIKKVIYGFQGGESIFANINQPVTFTGYLSRDELLPPELIDFKATLMQELAQLAEQGGDLFSYRFMEPEADEGAIAAEIGDVYGFQPMALSLLDEKRFFFYLTLQGETGGSAPTVVQIPLPVGFAAEGLQQSLKEGLKRYAQGLLRTVVVSSPQAVPMYMQSQGQSPTNQFEQLKNALRQDFNVVDDDLSSGEVPSAADLLMVLDPTDFDAKQRFAVDQFLMRGGTVVVVSGAFATEFGQRTLQARPRTSGLRDWLAHHGVSLADKLVMDPQNAAFPVPVTRQAGGFSFQDLVMLDYPYFADIRESGFAPESPLTGGLPQVIMSWASPLSVAASEAVIATDILRSTPDSWLSASIDVMPRMAADRVPPFQSDGETAAQLLAVQLQGRFDSYFAGQDSPLLDTSDASDKTTSGANQGEGQTIAESGRVESVITRSPESARLFVFSSNDFVSDQTLSMIGAAGGALNDNSIQLMLNIADWALEEQSLTSIRSRGNFNRVLLPLTESEQQLFEYLNYFAALVLLVLLGWLSRRFYMQRQRQQRLWLAEKGLAEMGMEG